MILLALFVDKTETQPYILVMYIGEVIFGTIPDCS